MADIPAFYATLKADFGKLSDDKSLQAYITSGDVQKLILKTFDTVSPQILDSVVQAALGSYYH